MNTILRTANQRQAVMRNQVAYYKFKYLGAKFMSSMHGRWCLNTDVNLETFGPWLYMEKTVIAVNYSKSLMDNNIQYYCMDGSVFPGTKTLVESIRPLLLERSGIFFVCGNTSGDIKQRRRDSRLFLLVLIPSICIIACFSNSIYTMRVYCPYNKKKTMTCSLEDTNFMFSWQEQYSVNE